VVALKWPDRPHWEFDATVLGADVHGVWVGAPRGTTMRRPGVEFRAAQDQVTLVPHDRPFIATFYAGDGGPMPCEVYVDISTVPTWRDGRVSSIDLDGPSHPVGGDWSRMRWTSQSRPVRIRA